jgi:hypothetical protein
MELNERIAECDRQIEELQKRREEHKAQADTLDAKATDEILETGTSESAEAAFRLRAQLPPIDRALIARQTERAELVAAEAAAARLQRWREYRLIALALSVAIDSHHLALITVAEGHRDLVARINHAFHACPERRSDFNFEGLQDRLGALNTAEADQLRGNKIHPFTGGPVASVVDVGIDLVAMLLGRMPAELKIEESAPAPKEKGLEPDSQPAESSATTDTEEKKRTQTRRPAKAAAK